MSIEMNIERSNGVRVRVRVNPTKTCVVTVVSIDMNIDMITMLNTRCVTAGRWKKTPAAKKIVLWVEQTTYR